MIYMAKEKAIILLSGGLDSTTLAATSQEIFDLHALIFSYGQRHSKEIGYAVRAANKYCDGHYTIIQLSYMPHSPLTGFGDIPKDRKIDDKVAPTWVPGRNMLFLAYAGIEAQVQGAKYILIGVNSLDYSGYPDCRADFIGAMGNAINEAMGRKGDYILIWTPLQFKTKAEIVGLALDAGIDIDEETWSCYEGGDKPCGHCDSCQLRNEAIEIVMRERNAVH